MSPYVVFAVNSGALSPILGKVVAVFVSKFSIVVNFLLFLTKTKLF